MAHLASLESGRCLNHNTGGLTCADANSGQEDDVVRKWVHTAGKSIGWLVQMSLIHNTEVQM